MTHRLVAMLAAPTAPDDRAADTVRNRAQQVLRPSGALQRLDDLAIHIAAWHATTTPSIDRPGVLVFAGDHGITAAGVSAYPPEVTEAMLAAVRSERATINALARSVGATVSVFDVGVGVPTGDIRIETAMSDARVSDTITVAVDAVDAVVADGCDLLVVGELGIGNTTVSAALSAALIGGDAADWVGRGTGVDDGGLSRKQDAVRTAVARIADITDPIEIMREIGGTELVAMAAACARARHHRVPVVVDGYVATAAMLPLAIAAPGALDHCIAGHRSAEPGHRRLLEHLGMEPVLDLGMRLGEGSGAVAAIPLIRMACAAITEVPTFDEWFDATVPGGS